MALRTKTTQSQTLSKRALLSTSILGMNSIALDEFIKSQAEENPAIEIDILHADDSSIEELSDIAESSEKNEFRSFESYDSPAAEEKEATGPLNIQTMGMSLNEYLLDQIGALDMSAKERTVCEYIVYDLDEHGFFTESVQNLSTRFAIPGQAAQRLLSLMQSLEPLGVCAHDARHCLLIQLEHMQAPPLAKTIVENHFDLVAKNKLQVISKVLDCSPQEAEDCCRMIRELNPYPAQGYGSGPIQYVAPDVVIRETETGYLCEIPDEEARRIRISPYYRELVRNGPDDETRAYVKTKVSQAEYLQVCIENRNSTLLDVTQAILEHQEGFFQFGTNALKPLTLHAVSQALGLHESTVSRAIKEKRLLCKWGLFELKEFFPSSVHAAFEESITPAEAKRTLEDVLKSENPAKPYSDRVLSDILNQRGIAISRRTVAKYRDSMGIPGISGRKRAV